jgi:hypothetical protein
MSLFAFCSSQRTGRAYSFVPVYFTENKGCQQITPFPIQRAQAQISRRLSREADLSDAFLKQHK